MLAQAVRRSRTSTEETPLLVLLHGLGSDERDLLALALELDPALTVVSLRAPHAYAGGGFAWFDVEWGEDGITVDSTQALASLDVLVEQVEAIPAEFGVRTGNVIVGGFSQGAMMACGVLLRIPRVLRGALLMSGAPMPAFFGDAPREGLGGVPILQQHGTMDPVLPVSLGREARDLLVGLGASVDYREYGMGHQVSLESLSDAKRWLDGLITPTVPQA